jgi:hypothetical protein
MGFSRWPAGRIFLLCVAWAVIFGVLFAWRIAREFEAVAAQMEQLEKAGIATVSWGVAEPAAFLLLFGPPLLLIVCWLAAKRRGRGSLLPPS